MRKKRKDPVKIVLGIAVGVLFVTATLFAVQYLDTIRYYKNDSLVIKQAEMQEENAVLLASLADAEKRVADIEAEQHRLSEELQMYIEAVGSNTDFVAEMNTRLQTLRDNLAAATKERDSLQEKIDVLEAMYADDFSEKTRMITELMTLLLEGAPMRELATEEVTETLSAWETTETEEPPVTEVYPNIAVYYQDLTTGYSVSYNADSIVYSASLIKLPYIYAVLREIAEFEENKLQFTEDGQPLYDEEGVPLFEGEHPNLDEDGKIIYKDGEEKYDLSREWQYDPETMFKEGSGKIQYESDGFTLTYRELIQYTILFSDNVAFEQLRQIFGMDSFYGLVGRLGIKGTAYGFMQLSAADCAAVLADIYAYFETEEEYALFLKDIMIRSAHSVMISAAVYPVTCAHKYGWDEASYHDMAIVLDEHPYIIVVMTDLDKGGEEINAYIRSLVQKCREIHYSTYNGSNITENADKR